MFSVLLLDLSSCSGSFFGFGLNCSWVWLHLHKLLWLQNFRLTSLPPGMICFCILASNYFSFFHNSHSLESTTWFCLQSMHFWGCLPSTWFLIFLQFLHAGGLVHFSLWYPNLWHLRHLYEFGMYISTLFIVYPIFFSVGGFEVLKLICVFAKTVRLFFLMEILWVSVTPCLQRLVFISPRVQRERSGLLITPLNEFKELQR